MMIRKDDKVISKEMAEIFVFNATDEIMHLADDSPVSLAELETYVQAAIAHKNGLFE